jgi:hypothetical protein
MWRIGVRWAKDGLSAEFVDKKTAQKECDRLNELNSPFEYHLIEVPEKPRTVFALFAYSGRNDLHLYGLYETEKAAQNEKTRLDELHKDTPVRYCVREQQVKS